jgi:hypothetical protein
VITSSVASPRPTGRSRSIGTTTTAVARQDHLDDMPIATTEATSTRGSEGSPGPRRVVAPREPDKRVWASIVHSPQQVIRDAFDEALRRDPERSRRWVVLVDGNKDQLARIKRAARDVGVEITIVLDIVHVLEYLWSAAYAFHPEGGTEAETWVECRFLALLNGRSGGGLAKSMRAMIESHQLDVAAAEPVEAATTPDRRPRRSAWTAACPRPANVGDLTASGVRRTCQPRSVETPLPPAHDETSFECPRRAGRRDDGGLAAVEPAATSESRQEVPASKSTGTSWR